ncbi:YqzK family protein [Halalkalibacterium ligniniphilum]|uniref:YqzK family protein n=1 Tax=Halalkalibacterium ligniniphilum TaxID=1134413 RepID=UPI00034AF1C7|nr:YqzK family protein [Halalkalibacterium ligniniphilum]
MKSLLTVVFQTIKVFLIFMGCTLLFYYGILWISAEYESYHRYDEPKGKAVKVIKMETEEERTMVDRLMLFYHFGE